MRQIEFVSYSGCYPRLCCGELILSIDGKEHKIACHMNSGGRCFIDEIYQIQTKGEWDITFYDDFFTTEEQEYITELVNENVEQGCCGGCGCNI